MWMILVAFLVAVIVSPFVIIPIWGWFTEDPNDPEIQRFYALLQRRH